MNLYSQYVVLYSLDSDTEWYDLRANDRIYPASMTKIMTALVAIEHIGDLSVKTSVSQELYDALYLEGASMAGFMPGEELTIEDMLYGALLPSGGEATAALAVYVAGSEDEFAQLMNERAASIGMTNTHFTNASGLHDENHYSTVYDIMLLVREAIQNEDFLRIFTTVSTHSTPTEEHPEGVWLGSSMFRYIGDRSLEGLKVLGGKTGYTDEAGNCLASLSEADGERFILVTAYGPAWSEGKPYVDDLFNIYTEVLRWKRGEAQ